MLMPDVFPTPIPDPAKPDQKNAPSANVEDELTYTRILVPIDFSEYSKKSTSYAARFASRYNATLQLLHVFELPDYAVTRHEHVQSSSGLFKTQAEAAEQAARENLTAIENELRNRGIKVEAYQCVGCPFDEIVQMSKRLNVDLIIIGSHGRTGLTHLLLGSTAERVVEHAQCPVLVVKQP
jgi:nucleotide-binding universal stress UspA family protein